MEGYVVFLSSRTDSSGLWMNDWPCQSSEVGSSAWRSSRPTGQGVLIFSSRPRGISSVLYIYIYIYIYGHVHRVSDVRLMQLRTCISCSLFKQLKHEQLTPSLARRESRSIWLPHMKAYSSVALCVVCNQGRRYTWQHATKLLALCAANIATEGGHFSDSHKLIWLQDKVFIGASMNSVCLLS